MAKDESSPEQTRPLQDIGTIASVAAAQRARRALRPQQTCLRSERSGPLVY